MKSIVLIGTLLAAICLPGCNNIEKTRQVISVDNNELYKVFIVDEPEIIKDVVYDASNNLKMDVYFAKDDNSNDEHRAAIVLFHGGGFTKGDKESDELTKAMSIDLSRMGYIVFIANYSLSEKANIKAIKNACKDAETAILYIQEHSDEYGVDKNHIAVGGYSAGAIIAKNIVYSNKYSFDTNDILAVIDIAGGKLTFGKPNSANPGCLIVHGNEDTTVAYEDAVHFAKELEDAGIDYEFQTLDKIGHTLITEFDDIRNKSAEYLYKQLCGEKITVDLLSKTNPEYAKIEKRKNNGNTYTLKNIEQRLNGDLSIWEGSQKGLLDKIKDAGSTLPSKDEYEGYCYVGINHDNPNNLYFAFSINDTDISVSDAKGSKWYNDDCIEIALDFSSNEDIEPVRKWIIAANGTKLSEKANENNTKVNLIKDGDVTIYEIEIDLSEYGFDSSRKLDFGMSVSYNNAKNGTREYQLGLTEGKSSDRTLFVNVVNE